MNFVDLGLPSGTLWAEHNEEGLYTFDEAVKEFGSSLPTREQFEELWNKCRWKRIREGYKVTGPNGNTIFLSAEGYRSGGGSLYYVGSAGYYWSSTTEDLESAWRLYFNPSIVQLYESFRCNGFSVRLVK